MPFMQDGAQLKRGRHAALLLAAAMWFAPSAALAQPEPEPEGEPPAEGEGEQPAEGEPPAEGEGEPGGEEGITDIESGLKELCEIDPDNCVQIDFEEYAKRDVEAEMYAVQQIWFLREMRFEINPYAALTMNDQFVSHNGPGIALNFYILNWLAVGANFNYYLGLNSPSAFNFETSRAARIGQPITEYQVNVNGNVTFVPAYGKFAAFENFIFHYDFYFLIGGGIITTRPVAVIDPDNRTFEYGVKPTWGFGGGIRIAFTRWLAATLEVRDYMFFDELENPSIAQGFDSQGNPRAQDPETWAGETDFTNNVQAQLGLSFFVPPTWEYELPK
jgi:outer membrane beta-barrel protein